jgi:hypothetical protein
VARDSHDGSVAGVALGKLRDRAVAQVVKPETTEGRGCTLSCGDSSPEAFASA